MNKLLCFIFSGGGGLLRLAMSLRNYGLQGVNNQSMPLILNLEGFNDWGGRGYDDFVPGKVTKTAPSGDGTT